MKNEKRNGKKSKRKTKFTPPPFPPGTEDKKTKLLINFRKRQIPVNIPPHTSKQKATPPPRTKDKKGNLSINKKNRYQLFTPCADKNATPPPRQSHTHSI